MERYKLECIKPPIVKENIFLSPEGRRSMQESYDDCIASLDRERRDRLEKLKIIRTTITKKIHLPGSEITVTPNKDTTELTITNGIDTLEIGLGDNITYPAVTLRGTVGYSAGVLLGYTFDIDTVESAAYTAALALKLLELKRYPERFGYKNIVFQLKENGDINIFSIQNNGEKVPVFSHSYNNLTNKINSYRDIQEFISTIFQNIPKEKTEEGGMDNNDEWDWDMS